MNFGSIALLENATQVGAQLAVDYPEYRDTIIEYLCLTRITHWEIDVRKSSARALSIICQNADCLRIFYSHWYRLVSDADSNVNDFKTHGGVLALSVSLRHVTAAYPSELEPVRSIVAKLIDSRHFSSPDMMSHFIRPSILELLTEYSRIAIDLGQNTDDFPVWLEKIQNSIMKMGALADKYQYQNRRELCAQITPAMSLLITRISPEKQRDIVQTLAQLIQSDQRRVRNPWSAFLIEQS